MYAHSLFSPIDDDDDNYNFICPLSASSSYSLLDADNNDDSDDNDNDGADDNYTDNSSTTTTTTDLESASLSSAREIARLRAELAAHAGAPLSALLALPYLDAVVQEGLRVWSPIPMSFPRVVPRGGRTVDGVALPAGTVVSCQPYTLHRLDEAVFPDPHEFRPERWLEPAGAVERNQLFFAFAAGGRGCIGKQ